MDTNYMQNRELSWLKFNDRVMSEAMDVSVPVLERLRFLTIFTTNLDEFFMVRVGSLIDIQRSDKKYKDPRSGMTAKEQLSKIYSAVAPLYKKRDALYVEIESLLRTHGIYKLSFPELTGDEQEYVERYFINSVLPVLSPEIIDIHHPFPRLQNKVIAVAAMLKAENDQQAFALIPVPEALPDIVYLPGKQVRYISMEDIIYTFVDVVFDTYEVEEKVELCITRNADIHAEDEELEVSDDFRKIMSAMLRMRRRLAPVRLELSNAVSSSFYDYLKTKFHLSHRQIFFTTSPLRLDYAYPLADKLDKETKAELTYPSFSPQIPNIVRPDVPMMEQVRRKDILLSYPYESMDPFLQMVKEAADDPDVISIQITIYRLAGSSRLVEYLKRAAENGKQVVTLVELRARFDEQNNIDWSQELERSGCTVIYGLPNYKVHSKVCLITSKTKDGLSFLTQIGTGNYNEKTSKLYTDFSLLTANQDIGRDAGVFFQNMSKGNLFGEYENLLAAPVSLKKRVLEMMDREIAKGSRGRIFFKMNSLTDKDVIKKLIKASESGVKVRMLIRGICCIVPGIPDHTDNIEVRSIVGRNLEHSRIYMFGEGDDELLYISSADMMTRNTTRRVEVGCPIWDPDVRKKIHNVIDIFWSDTLKARRLGPDGKYSKLSGDPHDAQQEQMELSLKNACPVTPTYGAGRRQTLAQRRAKAGGDKRAQKEELVTISAPTIHQLWGRIFAITFAAIGHAISRLFRRKKKN